MTTSQSLPDEHIYAIGLLVTNMTRTESSLIDLATVTTGADILHVLILLGTQSFSNKIDCVKASYSIGNTDDELRSDPVIALLNQIKKVGDFRNTVVHSMWADDAGVLHAVKFDARGKLRRHKHPAPTADILAQALEAERLGTELRGIVQALRAQGQPT